MDVDQWVRSRAAVTDGHLDAAGCGVVSVAALEAEVAHLHDEAAKGGYVAEYAAEPAIRAGRDRLGALLGLSGADVALPANGRDALLSLMVCWPLGAGARIGIVLSDYAPTAVSLAELAAARGWELVALPVDALGRVVEVPRGLDLLALPQVASQRGVVQPVTELVASGVPVVLDVAQSLGQTAVPPGCAAYAGTSRKWLCGPRGVGLLAIDPAFALRDPVGSDHQAVRRWDAGETHVAGRVGWAVAVQEWDPALLPVVHRRAAYARSVLAGTPWTVVEPVDEPSGITTLVPPEGVSVPQTRARLVAEGLVTSAVPATRSADLTGPVLRVSTHAWVPDASLSRLAGLLSPA